MIRRTITDFLRKTFSHYPVVTITGPRQSGKTTLCRKTFPEKPYVNLESPETRERALLDPVGFLKQFGEGAILDEIQRAPQLVSYLQVLVDELGKNSLFILTGSQQLEVTQAITQSLAGRTAILRLLPFSLEELGEGIPIDKLLYSGFYPRIHDQKLNPTQTLGDYFETYVERDLRQLSNIRNLSSFQRFVKLCAGRTGQLLNLQSLGNDAGVSHTTAREWVSLLEASYIVFLLQPYHENIGKRLLKAPKLYFYDVGLASYLLGIENQKQIASHPLRGNLFENLVVMETLKHRFHRGKKNNLSFYRESGGNEVDLLYDLAGRFAAIEIKAGSTFASDYLKGFKHLEKALPKTLLGKVLVYAGEASHEIRDVTLANPFTLCKELRRLDREIDER